MNCYFSEIFLRAKMSKGASKCLKIKKKLRFNILNEEKSQTILLYKHFLKFSKAFIRILCVVLLNKLSHFMLNDWKKCTKFKSEVFDLMLHILEFTNARKILNGQSSFAINTYSQWLIANAFLIIVHLQV